jgi:hypothetical protein
MQAVRRLVNVERNDRAGDVPSTRTMAFFRHVTAVDSFDSKKLRVTYDTVFRFTFFSVCHRFPPLLGRRPF